MSYLNETYVDVLGFDFTEYVNTKEDYEIFQKMCEHEERTIDVPLKDCIQDVVAVLNLESRLKGKPDRAKIVKVPKDPRLN